MGIQDLGAIGEFISSIVIVATLVVLIYEVRQNSTLLRRSANRETIRGLGDALRLAVENDELAALLDRFDESYESLNPTEKRRTGLYHTLWFQQFELINEDHKIGYYDDEPFSPSAGSRRAIPPRPRVPRRLPRSRWTRRGG